jgi:hypothetical protein
MADSFEWKLYSISADRKQAVIYDASVYDSNPRSSYTIGISGRRIGGDKNSGIPLDFTQDYPESVEYSFYLEGKPHNGDGVYWFVVTYDPEFIGSEERNFGLILTPTTEYNYSNMVSELSEECCSVDFRMNRLTNMLLVGCFLDSIFVIKDRHQGLTYAQEFNTYDAERLIRRAESIIE